MDTSIKKNTFSNSNEKKKRYRVNWYGHPGHGKKSINGEKKKKMYKWEKKGRKMDPDIGRGTHKLSPIPYFKKKMERKFSIQ